MSRIGALVARIEQGVKDGYITEKERREFLSTKISSKFDISRLEEAVEKAIHVEG